MASLENHPSRPDTSTSPSVSKHHSDAFPNDPTVSDSSSLPTQISVTPPPAGPGEQPILARGVLLGRRYEIAGLIGVGGMGAVYEANDSELNRTVALKVVRPDLASDTSIVQRFKQELLLAREVTHKNVIRIYDLGESEGLRFITMEFIEGEDLRSLLVRKKKFNADEALDIMRQVCEALEAAHGAHVIHRDLKPQNIMREQSGRILVMDFGLARTFEGDGLTKTGALLGTMEYMSPEQALGKECDQRSDIFTFGLIFYELLTGKMPYKAESAVASLLKRAHEHAIPVASLDPTIPPVLSNIVSKCLDPEVTLRYQSASEILADLDAWQGGRAPATLRFPSKAVTGQVIPGSWLAIPALLVLAAAGVLLQKKLASPKPSAAVVAQPLSLAVVPFHNAANDPSLDWLGPVMAEMLTTDVGQSPQLRTLTSNRLQNIFADLRIPPQAAIQPSTLQRVAQSAGADILVSGQYVRSGDHIRLDSILQDVKHDRRLSLATENLQETEIPAAVDQLAESIRQNLGMTQAAVAELKSTAYQPASRAPEALRAYSDGIRLLRDGRNIEAVGKFHSAVKADPRFALAYSRLAQADSAIHYDTEAEEASRHAIELSSQLPGIQRDLIQAAHASVIKDDKKAIQSYENLAQRTPQNPDIEYALASLYLDQSDYDRARTHYANVLQLEPKNINALLYTGWVEVATGKPQDGLGALNQALTLAIAGDNQEQKGEILQALGIAYENMSRSEEALRTFRQALDIDQQLGKKAAVANSLVEMGNVQASLGHPQQAVANYSSALAIQRQIGAKSSIAATLVSMGQQLEDGGQYEKALQLYKEALQTFRDLGDQYDQATCLNNIGNAYQSEGRNDDALIYFQQSLQLRQQLNASADAATTMHNLGEVYTKTAQYNNAMNSYMQALDFYRKSGDARGAALESHGLGMVFEYQGRYGAAIKSLEESVNGFHAIKDRSRIMAQVLIDYAEGLALVGRGPEAGKTLDEARELALELKNDNLVAGVLNAKGDLSFYSRDLTLAKTLYEQALQTASRGKGEDRILSSKFNLAKVAVRQKQLRALTELRNIGQQADILGRKCLSVEDRILLSESMIQNKDYSHAQQELERALASSDKLGLRAQSASIHHLLGQLLRMTGHPDDAITHYRQSLSLLDEMKKEPGAEKLLDRYDLKSVYDEDIRFARSTTS